jgi:hypothetical protein
MTTPANPLANLLPNSTTKILTSTYVPLSEPADDTKSGRALLKASFVGSLVLQTGEVDSVKKSLTAGASTGAESFWSLLRQYEGTPLASQLPSPSTFVDIAPTDLTAFANGLVAIRQQAVERLQQPATGAPDTSASKSQPTSNGQNAGLALYLLNAAVVQAKSLANNSATAQVGMLNLERLEMTPAGIERGGLIATIPLAPKERTFVVQKEWSVTTQEFTSIVTDSLDNYSETGVTENTQLTQATTSQIAHNNQYNVTASASGGVNFVVASGSASASTSIGSQDQNSSSANTSRQNAVQTTRQASSRVKQSHKTTISTTSVSGTSEATTRKLENPSATDAMRIDYFSIMRKWYVALYRYGLRLTYDITVPEPGAAFRESFMQLDKLQKQAAGNFAFNLTPEQITAETLPGYLQQWPASIPPAPASTISKFVIHTMDNLSDTDHMHYEPVPFDLDTDYVVDSSSSQTVDYVYDGESHTSIDNTELKCLEDNLTPAQAYAKLTSNTAQQSYTSQLSSLVGQQGNLQATYRHCGIAAATMRLSIVGALTPAALATWQSQAWTALYNAAQTQYYAEVQAINAQITALQNQINNVDTLTLRREENDEIMKCALRWLLSPFFNFAFMPQDVQALFLAAAVQDNPSAASSDLRYGVDFTGNQTLLTPTLWKVLAGNEQTISFINEAIEWENVVFFTYSYFWDYPECWDFIRQIQHNDKTRQAFLRAGSARIILTVRQGWEERWANFVNTGDTTLPAIGSPSYLTIAKQIEAYDATNYPGIPPANPDGGGLIDDDTPQVGTTCNGNIQPSAANPLTTSVNIPVSDVSGFVVGATAIIDNWDAQLVANSQGILVGPGGQVGIGAQETQTIIAVAPPNIAAGGTTAVPGTITVQGLQYSHSGPFPVVQAGAKGVLIGEWFEYTPTSGTDIQVTLNPTGPYA